MTTERWVGPREVAEHLGMAEYTVRVWAQTGEIPAAKVGRVWRFKISAVEAHLRRPRNPWEAPEYSPIQRKWARYSDS